MLKNSRDLLEACMAEIADVQLSLLEYFLRCPLSVEVVRP